MMQATIIDPSLNTASKMGKDLIPCQRREVPQELEWANRYHDFRRRRYLLMCCNMCMGPATAFPEYFSPDYDINDLHKHGHGSLPKKNSAAPRKGQCHRECAGVGIPQRFDYNPVVEYQTTISLGYVPLRLRQHHRYCGCTALPPIVRTPNV